MKNYILILAFIFITITSCRLYQPNTALNQPIQKDLSGSQAEINTQQLNKLDLSLIKLDSVYNAVLREYKEQTIFIKNFKKSQLIWEQYLEAQLLARFPEDEEYRGGSSFGMCYSLYKQQLINERITALKDWLIGFPEGEMCGGSVKVMGY
ncbi:MAG: DUF1311 domain-containing protein [Crocinitomicaceae bacterium]|nr:DUF1311 domain-containing protein [Crocinitomicaceae bacterium]